MNEILHKQLEKAVGMPLTEVRSEASAITSYPRGNFSMLKLPEGKHFEGDSKELAHKIERLPNVIAASVLYTTLSIHYYVEL